MNLMLLQSKYRPKIFINISDNHEVYETGQFKIRLSTPHEAMNSHEELMSNYWEEVGMYLFEYYKVNFFNSIRIAHSTLKRAINSLNYHMIAELVIFAYILNNCQTAQLIVDRDNTFKLICPEMIINELKNRMDVSKFIPLESYNLLNGAA